MANIATLAQRATSVAQRSTATAAAGMRTVGVSRISAAEAKTAAVAVTKLPQQQKKQLADLLTKRNVMIGGVALGGGIIGMSADELADIIANANPAELLDFLSVADEISPETGDAIASAHDTAVRFQSLDQDFSATRAEDFEVAPISMGQLSWSRDLAEEQQQWVRVMDLVSRVMPYETLEALIKLITGTTPENRAMLQDMLVAGRRGGY